ncbi:MAG: SDR family NAD(P)-dependent oxidoreductase, partial [Bacilli bacterium]
MESRRVALITGSATGLGTQVAKGLAREGLHVVINYKNSIQKAFLLQQEVNSFGVECILVQGDISIKEDCEKIVSETIRHFGKLDILINNAGPYMFERKKLADYG